MKYKVGIIGCGNMGKILVDTLCSLVNKKNIFCFDVDAEKLEEIKKSYKVNICSSNKEVVLNSDIIIFAVKPQQMNEVVKEIKEYVDETKVIVSIAAGIKIAFFNKNFKNNPVIRIMPNLPIKNSCGVSAICKNNLCRKKEYEFVKKIFERKGVVVEVKEKLMDLITAVSGSGPAYIFYVSEIIQKVASKLGLDKKIVPKIVNYTILGAAKMLTEEKLSAEELRKAVTSKKGTTEQAIKVFKSCGLEKIFYTAIKKAMYRAKELSEEVSK
jgi:pyrroline-5-carboxylate reductase